MMSRRGLWGIAVGAAAVVLSGCGGNERFARKLTELVAAVPGVDAVELEVTSSAEFQRTLVGHVEITPSDGSRPIDVFDEVIGAIVRAVADTDGYDHLELRWFTGLSSGTEITVWDLDPEFVRDEQLRAAALFERYGVH